MSSPTRSGQNYVCANIVGAMGEHEVTIAIAIAIESSSKAIHGLITFWILIPLSFLSVVVGDNCLPFHSRVEAKPCCGNNWALVGLITKLCQQYPISKYGE